jgi:hypothetical protein
VCYHSVVALEFGRPGGIPKRQKGGVNLGEPSEGVDGTGEGSGSLNIDTYYLTALGQETAWCA